MRLIDVVTVKVPFFKNLPKMANMLTPVEIIRGTESAFILPYRSIHLKIHSVKITLTVFNGLLIGL